MQLYVAIKSYKVKSDETFALLALLYSRANVPLTTPLMAISFGTAAVMAERLPLAIRPLLTGVGFGGPPCDQAGLAAYQLPLPLASFYHGVPMPPGLPAYLNLDLFHLQGRIFC